MGFYHRMTEPIEIQITTNTETYQQHIDIPTNITVEETQDENIMCMICNIIKQNVKLIPCNHTQMCSKCCEHMKKTKNILKCPFCCTQVTKIIKN